MERKGREATAEGYGRFFLAAWRDCQEGGLALMTSAGWW